MRYLPEFIDEVVQCYFRVNNKNFVKNKYKITAITLNKWIVRYEQNKESNQYAKRLEKIEQVLAYYDDVKDYDLVVKKFKLKHSGIENLLYEYRLEVLWKTPNFAKIRDEFKGLYSFLTKAYKKNKSSLILEKIVLIDLLLGRSDEDVITRNNISKNTLNIIKEYYK